MTKTYGEKRQEIYFRAARELRKLAAEVLDDVQNEVELQSETTLRWAISLATTTAKKAQALADLGHEETVAPRRAENDLYKARRVYDAAIDAFEARVQAQPDGFRLLEAVKNASFLAYQET